MTKPSIYQLRTPSTWSHGPEIFSFSSLLNMDTCLLQWQLVHSGYGEFSSFPARPSPAAVEGDIVHQVLDKLFKSMSLAGLPSIGSTEFAEVVARVNLRKLVDELILKHESAISAHPRSGGFRLNVGAQELVNRIIRLFRAEYASLVPTAPRIVVTQPLDASSCETPASLLSLLGDRGALSEIRLVHPKLPFLGVIDLVKHSQKKTVIVDFKTGAPKEFHKEQLLYYAVLWWRNTGEIPQELQVCYPSLTSSITIDEGLLRETEEVLSKRISAVKAKLDVPPAPSTTGAHCSFCDVRQFCADYWKSSQGKSGISKYTNTKDFELVAQTPATSNGFTGKNSAGNEIPVVYATDVTKVFGVIPAGIKIRILNAYITDDGKTIELKPWTEIFHA